jgi:hypothetical protein
MAKVKQWSLRSQRSLKRQYKLEDEIGKFENLIGYEERNLKAAEENRLRQAKLVAGGQPIYTRNLEDSLEEISQRKQKILAYQETIAGFRLEIEGLQPTASQAAERARKQAQLSRIATKRMKGDARIDAATGQLKELLMGRARLTATMLKLASEIDFAGDGEFDSRRFDSLLMSLPGKMQPESARWLTWFWGEETDRRPSEVRRTIQSFPETLASPHYYREGEEPLLTEKQRAEMYADRPGVLSPGEVDALVNPPKQPEVDIREIMPYGLIR